VVDIGCRVAGAARRAGSGDCDGEHRAGADRGPYCGRLRLAAKAGVGARTL